MNGSKSSKVQEKLLLLKLKRIEELNNNLKELLAKDRIFASNASYTIINQITNEKDYVLPEISGYLNPGENPFRTEANRNANVDYDSEGCCTIM